MSGLQISMQFTDGGGVVAPELAATWGRLSIRIGDEVATLVRERATNSYRDEVDVSAYPLAEWIAYNWWQITTASYQRFSPEDKQDRISFASVGDGFAWPPMMLTATGDRYLVDMHRVHAPLERIEYVTASSWVTDYDDTTANLSSFVELVVRRLEDLGISDTPLQREWETVQSSDVETSAFCRAAAALGHDPYDVEDDLAQRILEVGQGFPNTELLIEALASVSASDMDVVAPWLSKGEERIASLVESAPANTTLSNLGESIPSRARKLHSGTHALPWVTGFQRARAVRDALNLGPQEPFDIESLTSLGSIGIKSPGSTEALGLANTDRAIVVVGPGRSKSAERFLRARVLDRALFAERSGVHVLGQGISYSDQVERAFAAELLAPAMGLAVMLKGNYFSEQGIAEAAEKFGVNPLVIQHQVENQVVA